MNGGRTLKTNVNVPTMYLDVKQSFEEKKKSVSCCYVRSLQYLYNLHVSSNARQETGTADSQKTERLMRRHH